MRKFILVILVVLTACTPDVETLIETITVIDELITDGTESVGTGGIYYIDNSEFGS